MAGSAINAIYGLLLLLVLAPSAAATQFKVGGDMGWAVPAGPKPISYNEWAEKRRFQIGDSLLFAYAPGRDSVLRVNKQDYTTCDTQLPIARFDNGNTVFILDKPGPYYFISGIRENCRRNESMVVVVMADRTGQQQSSSNRPGSPPPPYPNTAAAALVGVGGAFGAAVGSLILYLGF